MKRGSVIGYCMGVCTRFILAALPFFEVVGVVPLGILSGLHPVTTAVIDSSATFLPSCYSSSSWTDLKRGG